MHAASVAPVVKTSSTTSTCRPAAAADARNAPRTFAHRASAERSLCGWVVRTRATHRGRLTGALAIGISSETPALLDRNGIWAAEALELSPLAAAA